MESVIPGKARAQSENRRLNVQHELVKSIMGGTLLRAPVDLTRANLRILDSGTAQANWLLDVSSLVGPGATLIGTDIATGQFPPEASRPTGTTLQAQSIFEAWPLELRGTFDVVHQRFVLAACKNEEQARAAVAGLVALAKPGTGWVELHEGNMIRVGDDGGARHAAMVRFRDLAVAAWQTELGQIADAGVRIGDWLKGCEGITDTYEEVQTVKIGAAADDKEDGERGIDLCMTMFGGISRIISGKF